MGVGNAVETDGRESFWRLLGDTAAGAARRVFIDPAVLVMALFGLSYISFGALAIGAVCGLFLVLPTHFRIVHKLRETRAAE